MSFFRDVAYTLADTSFFLFSAEQAVSEREQRGLSDLSEFQSWVQTQLVDHLGKMVQPNDTRLAGRQDLQSQATEQHNMVYRIYQRALSLCQPPVPYTHPALASSALATSIQPLHTKAQIFQEMRNPNHAREYICFYNAFFNLGIYDDCPANDVKRREASAASQIRSVTDMTYRFGNFDADPEGQDFEFGGIRYKTREACFHAQKCDYQDSPVIRKEQFKDLSGEEAFQLRQAIKLSHSKSAEWDKNRDDVMLNVIRAEVGQNDRLKAVLLSTGSAYLCESRANPLAKDTYWSDGGDGTGQNRLGIAWMKVRAEAGGTGPVEKPEALKALHGRLKQLQGSSSASSAIATKSCSLSGCSKPCFVETSGKVHDYCGKDHAQKAQGKP